MKTSANLLAFCLISGLAAIFPTSLSSQSEQRQVEIEPLNRYAPVKITGIEVGSQSYPNPMGAHQDIHFSDANHEWISDVSVVVVNQSPKEITSVELMVEVPAWRGAGNEPRTSVLFHTGHLPEHARVDASGKTVEEQSDSVLKIPPEGATAISVHPSVPLLRSHPWRKSPIESLDGIVIGVRRVFFADGTMWVTNAYHKPSDAKPGLYERIMPEE